jgi:hypothetical protein
VLWGWAGQPVLGALLVDVEALAERLRGPLADRLREHITGDEVDALVARTEGMLADPVMPWPGDHRPIPWPAF